MAVAWPVTTSQWQTESSRTGEIFESMNFGLPKIAAPNRRLRLGPVPWSFGTLTSQGSAVGELERSARSVGWS